MGPAIAAGSEYVGMEPLVSSGPRTGVPHGTWRRRRLQPDEPAVLAMAGCHDRYHAALMRGAWLGATAGEGRGDEKVCQEALEAALAEIRPGAPCEAPHLACQRVIDRAGYTDNFRKRPAIASGISFAPDWGEGGILSLYTGVTTELRPGMTFHYPAGAPRLWPVRRGRQRDRRRHRDRLPGARHGRPRLLSRRVTRQFSIRGSGSMKDISECRSASARHLQHHRHAIHGRRRIRLCRPCPAASSA